MRESGGVIFAALLAALSVCADEQQAVALTFDDGPNPPYTEKLLQILKEKEVKATFFLIGQQVETCPDLGIQIQDWGHEIGGHSHDWDMLAFKRWKTVERKLDKMDAAFADAGITNIALFRPPIGMLSFGQKNKIEARGLKFILGDVVPGDRKDIDAETIRNRVLKKVRPGSVIVLHDGGGDRTETIKAVLLIVDALREQGYSFLTVSELTVE